MNKRLLLGAAFLATIVVGFLAGRGFAPGPGDGASQQAGTEPEVLYWVAPMDPNFRRDEPGKSPMGMDLVPVYADDVDGQPGVVSIDPTVVSNLGVRTARVQVGPLPRVIETVGYVGYDEDTLRHVHTRVEGWIEALSTSAVGDTIEAGQLLFELYSPTLVNAQQEYLAALSSNNASLRTASRERLVALGVSDTDISRLESERTVEQRLRVFADNSGVVAELGVREGIYVTPATDILAIAEIDRVWVIAEVFERQAAQVSGGQHAEVAFDHLPGQSWHGVVDHVYPELDPVTRTLRVRLRFDNPGVVLRPNMFARVTIRGDGTGDVLHVPREAIVRGGRGDRVVVALGDGRFRAQPVTVGVESGNRVAILDGLGSSDRIVVSGQFLIDSESNIESAFGRMGPDGDSGRMDHGGHEMGDDAESDHGDHGDNGDHDMSDHSDMDHSGHDMDATR